MNSEENSIAAAPGNSGTASIKAVLGQVLSSILFSSAFIACCAFFLTVETALLARVPVSLPLAAFVFLATLFTYNLNNIQRVLRQPQRERQPPQTWAQRNQPALALLGLASIAAAVVLYLAYDLQLNTWFMLHLALISVGYTIPILYKQKRVRPLRSVPLLKVFLIAYVWAAVTVFFPLMDAGQEVWERAALLLFARRFLFILALALLFDIRDYSYDRTTNTLTFPGLIGIQNTKLLSLGLLLLYTLVAIVMEQSSITVAALVASAVGAAVVVYFASENKPPVYYVLLADGAMLLHAGLVYLANSLYLQ